MKRVERKFEVFCTAVLSILLVFFLSFFMTGCGKEKEEQGKSEEPEELKENYDSSDAQLSATAVYCGDTMYYLGNTEIGEGGEEGCYLYHYGSEEKYFLSYDNYGRGIYADGEKLYLLTHDDTTWSLSLWKEGQIEKAVDIAAYSEDTMARGTPINLCVRVYDDYVYLVPKDVWEPSEKASDELPENYEILGGTLIRFSISDAKWETVWLPEKKDDDHSKIYCNIQFQGKYLSFLEIDELEKTTDIHVYSLETLQELQKLTDSTLHYVMDKNGALYYSLMQGDGKIALVKKAIGKDEEVLYSADVVEAEKDMFLADFDVYYDGTYFYLDNRLFSDKYYDDVIERCIHVVDRNGEQTTELHFEEIAAQCGNKAVAFSDVVYSDENTLMLNVDVEGSINRFVYDKQQLSGNTEHWSMIANAEQENTNMVLLDMEKKYEFDIENGEPIRSGSWTYSPDTEYSFTYVNEQGEEGELKLNVGVYLICDTSYKGVANCRPDLSGMDIKSVNGGELIRIEEILCSLDKDNLSMYERDFFERKYIFNVGNGQEFCITFTCGNLYGKLNPDGGYSTFSNTCILE